MKFRTLVLLTAIVVALQIVLAVYVGVSIRDPKVAGQLIEFCLKADAVLVALYGAGQALRENVK